MNNSVQISSIINIWNKVIDLGMSLRNKHSNNLDGLAVWNNLKSSVVDISKDPLIKWSKTHDKIVYSLSEMKNSLREYDEDNNFIERNHFLLQILNIPKNDPTVSFNKLIQIAFNIGQLMPELNDKKFGFNIQQIFNDNKLNEINTYISNKDLEKYKISQNEIDDILLTIQNLKNKPFLKLQKGSGRYIINYSN